jgi:hypothetical protein
MNLKMQSLIIKRLRISRFMGAWRAKNAGEVLLLLLSLLLLSIPIAVGLRLTRG